MVFNIFGAEKGVRRIVYFCFLFVIVNISETLNIIANMPAVSKKGKKNAEAKEAVVDEKEETQVRHAGFVLVDLLCNGG